jgi:hypothetical protein
MERRDRSLKALKELYYIDSQEPALRAKLLDSWVDENLVKSKIDDFDLELSDLKKLYELFFKNIAFMKQHRVDMKKEIDNYKKIREFLK